MPEDDQPEKVWDEYDWERFLQQQDRKTEKYMELLERYIDDPDRDQIIAREMGWNHLLNKEGQAWAESVEESFDGDMCDGAEAGAGGDDAGEFSYEVHPLYQAALMLTTWLDELLTELPPSVQEHPAAVQLSSNLTIAVSKLAAALSDDGVDEIGMTIAYLKRALRAVTLGLEAGLQLEAGGLLDAPRFGALQGRMFEVRDGIIEQMGACRSEWRRRYE